MDIRLPAEWEEQKSLIVVFPTEQLDWQHSIKQIQNAYINFINAIKKYQKCVIICNNKDLLIDLFENLNNLEIYEIQTNDTWIRDFGAIDFFKNNILYSYNFTFNAWGNKFESILDNNFNKKIFTKNLIDIDFILEGGSIDTNGQGTLLTTSKCIYNTNRNSTLSKININQTIKKLFGIEELIVLKSGGLVGDDTDSHIDTLARFINKDTIAYVKCSDNKDEHFEELNAMEKELQSTKYNLLPIPLPQAQYFEGQRLPATYLNFVFINNALILPTYNDPSDEIVVQLLKPYIKNREIICIDSTIFIREHGSLHCSSINQYL